MECKICADQTDNDICNNCDKQLKEDKTLQSVLVKIDEGSITCDDINKLIAETTPESIRDRIRRRMKLDTNKKHLDDAGHQKLKLPEFGKRIMPKRKPVNQQNHGRSKIAHKHSVRTQAKQSPYMEAICHIKETIGKPINEQTIKSSIPHLSAVATKMMSLPNIDRDWLYRLTKYLNS